MKKPRVAINGFGVIGRLFFRQAYGLPEFDIVALNDLGEVENLAYLLKHDSVYRTYARTVSFSPKTARKPAKLLIGEQSVSFYQEKDPAKLPWKEEEIDIVVESSGAFESFEAARAHLTAGAKRVVLTAPAKDPDGTDAKTVLVGINEGELETSCLSSNASCTTNAASPVIQVLIEKLGIKKAVLSTAHAYTATQSVADGPVRGGHDFRRGRAAAENIALSTTGAAIAVARAVPALAGKFDGIAIRVPVVSGSVADITFVSARPTTVDEVNSIFEAAAADPRWKGILKVTREQIVSSDIIGEEAGAIVDLSFTKVVDGDLVKVFSWYDNEWGYVSTLVRHVKDVAALIGN